ncbi:hypothetical protein FHW79_005367 [Azospirillum sp. OGB3]|uniref:hypothetical protein n=1 Tax=Azospirillum sp. OGB3 TaxID=2587012 RepID=UPI001605ACE9|nr:hypothetical protein [Azospirillum sp. OGB3]MBB3267702.1 hypothetical protein [Azospirillum sp. OGB3]
MPERKFEYGSAELWAFVEGLGQRPSRLGGTEKSRIAKVEAGGRIVSRWPVEEYVDGGIAGVRPKGLRPDAVLLEKLSSALRTGRATRGEVHHVLGSMFGEDVRHAWDGIVDVFEAVYAGGDLPPMRPEVRVTKRPTAKR